MKTRFGWMLAVLGVCGAVGGAWAAKKQLVSISAADLKWMEVPESGGVQIANVAGDMMKGSHSSFAKIPAGQKHPLHTHTNEEKLVVVSGTFLVGLEGEPEKPLAPGSYMVIPGGLKHTSSCAEGAPCVIFSQGTGKFDMKPVVDKPTAKK